MGQSIVRSLKKCFAPSNRKFSKALHGPNCFFQVCSWAELPSFKRRNLGSNFNAFFMIFVFCALFKGLNVVVDL